MPINPIEFQGSIPRTQDVAQQKYHENMKPQNDQMNFQTQLDRNISNKHQQVNKQDNADKKEKKYDAKEKGNGTYYKRDGDKNGKEKKRTKESEKLRNMEHGMFDIKI